MLNRKKLKHVAKKLDNYNLVSIFHGIIYKAYFFRDLNFVNFMICIN